MSSKDAETPDGASGSRWEPTEATESDVTAEQPALDEGAPSTSRWRRPSRTVSVAAAAAMAGLVIGGFGGWAAGSTRHDEHRVPPAMVGFQHGSGGPDGRMPGGPMGGPFGGPGGPGVMPGQPQPGQGNDSDDGTDDGQQS